MPQIGEVDIYCAYHVKIFSLMNQQWMLCDPQCSAVGTEKTRQAAGRSPRDELCHVSRDQRCHVTCLKIAIVIKQQKSMQCVRNKLQNKQQSPPRPATPRWTLELSTNLIAVFTITEKAPTRTFKSTSAITFKTLCYLLNRVGVRQECRGSVPCYNPILKPDTSKHDTRPREGITSGDVSCFIAFKATLLCN